MSLALQSHDLNAAVNPLDALLAHYNASTKKVQRAFINMIIGNYTEKQNAKKLETARQKAMVKESLTQAFKELRHAQATGQQLPDARKLFEELDD